jgi:MFS family permease
MFFLATLLASAGYYFGYYISIFNPVATPLLKNVLHLSDETTPSIKDVQGNIFSFTALMAFATLFFVPTINKRLGRLKAIFLGEILGILTMAPFLFLDQFESDIVKIRWLEGSRLLTGMVMALNTSSG